MAMRSHTVKTFKREQGEGETPQTVCPVCLEAWDTTSRLPKFLSCHHTVCLTCAGQLRATPTKAATRRPDQTPRSPVSPLVRLITARPTFSRTPDTEKEVEEVPVVRCPMCRVATPVPDPAELQTNFYLRGLLRQSFVPRLVLWCETCDNVAAPDCSPHHLRPLQDKLGLLQAEVVAEAAEARQWSAQRLGETGRQVQVYGWLADLLQCAHLRVADALTHARDTQTQLRHYHQHLTEMVNHGEVLRAAGEGEEEAVRELTDTAHQVRLRHAAMVAEIGVQELESCFMVQPEHRGPKGYHNALLVLKAAHSAVLTVYSDCESESEKTKGADAIGTPKSSRSHSLKDAFSRNSMRRLRPTRSAAGSASPADSGSSPPAQGQLAPTVEYVPHDISSPSLPQGHHVSQESQECKQQYQKGKNAILSENHDIKISAKEGDEHMAGELSVEEGEDVGPSHDPPPPREQDPPTHRRGRARVRQRRPRQHNKCHVM